MSTRARALAFAVVLGCATSAQAADKWTTPHPGMRQLTRTTSTPWRIWALEVDLCAEGVSLRATASNERKRTVSSFAKLVGAEAAVNGDFFSFSTYATSGLAMGKGAAWSDTQDQTSSGLLAFGYDRLLLSSPKSVVSPASWMREIVSGRPQIVSAGKPQATDPTEFCQTRHPRTAAGLSEDRRKLILAVVDGRTSISVGMKCTELAKLMKELGAHDALNLDGGGSSAMYVAGQGVVNDPSDGVERVVANHLAVFATGSGEPGSCDRSLEEASIASDAYEGSTTSDIDGDGRADLCARSSTGISCALSNGTSLSEPFAGPALADDGGWGDDDNWSTLRMGDIDGDGRADLCARANAGIRCWKSDGAGFAAKAIVGPELSDAKGFDHPAYHGTLRMADIDGDGKDDLCVRSASDFRCYPSTGDGFAEAVTLPDITDAAGFDAPSRHGTLRMGDVDGDGRDDVCARASDGMRCWLSTGSGFGSAIAGPKWADSSGWSFVGYWSTIRLADIDGDGRADLCARAAKGVICHLSEGSGFGPEIQGPTFSDAGGWWRHRYFSTLRFADLDADGDLDVCARAAKGIVCAAWQDGGYGELFDGPALSNDAGWGALRFYQTIRFADLDGDRRADLCARASAGVRCWLSQGSSFGEALTGPEWSDAKGWGSPKYFSTLRASGPRCLASELCGNGSDDDCNGTIDDGCGGSGGAGAGGGAAGPGAAGTSGWTGSGGDGGSGANAGSEDEPAAGDEGGCACRAAGTSSDGSVLGLAGVLLAFGWLRRRR